MVAWPKFSVHLIYGLCLLVDACWPKLEHPILKNLVGDWWKACQKPVRSCCRGYNMRFSLAGFSPAHATDFLSNRPRFARLCHRRCEANVHAPAFPQRGHSFREACKLLCNDTQPDSRACCHGVCVRCKANETWTRHCMVLVSHSWLQFVDACMLSPHHRIFLSD